MRRAVPDRPRGAITDDGDEVRFCSTCAFSAACLRSGHDKSALRQLHVLVDHVGPYRQGEHIFRAGQAFTAIAAVRQGAVKTYVTDLKGREQVLGFFLPGEIIGLNAISRARYPCHAMALETVFLCRFSFPRMAVLARELPTLQQELFRLMSEDIGRAGMLAGDFTADERLAGFLVMLSRRNAERGSPPEHFRLTMSRGDIGNYLRLDPATISRLLRRFQDEALIRVEGRDVRILNMPRMVALSRDVLRD